MPLPAASATRRAYLSALVALFLVVIGAATVAPRGSATGTTTQLLVKFSPGAAASNRAAALADVEGDVTGSVGDLGVDVVEVPAARASAALAALEHNPNVSYAEENGDLAPQEQLPNDPYFYAGSWALGGGAWGWGVTHTSQAWDVTEGDPRTVIAILDTGIKTSGLSDFAGQIASTWNVMTNTTDVTSNAGSHGTYVAGVAGLAIGNGTGNAGYCPECSLMIVQVGTDTGASFSDLANGVTYAADHGARVINMSWAGASDSSTLQNAINYAHGKGVVIVAAAGNSNCDCKTYPSGDTNVISVAGVSDAAGDKQGDSNYGSWVDVAAPEGNLTAWPTINGAPGYALVGGTSVAAPAVAGIAGLLFSYNPSLTDTQVEQALKSTAAPVTFPIAYGRVDALAALQSLGAVDPQATSAPVQTAATQIYYETNGTTDITPLTGSPQVGQVLVRGFGGWTGSAGLAILGLQWQRCNAAGTGCTLLGNQSTYTVQSTDAGSTIKLVFTVKNSVGSVAASALTAVVGGSWTPPPVAAPTNSAPPTVSGVAQVGQALSATTGSWSGSPTGYSYQWQRCDATGASCAAATGATSSSYSPQSGDVGATFRVAVTATNTGGSVSATSAATSAVTAAPAPTPTPTLKSTTFSASLSPQNQSRSFTVSVGTGLAHATLSFSKCSTLALGLSNGASTSGASGVSLDATLAAGSYTYTVSGGKCSFTLTVTAPSA